MKVLSFTTKIVFYPIVVLLLLAVLVLGIRLLMVHFDDPSVDTTHLTYKSQYLDKVASTEQQANRRHVASKGAEDKRPNIIVIFFDDLGFGDLSSYGNTLIKTPRIDSIAAAGLKFNQFYSASPVCTPSRASLLTGRYPPRTRTDWHVFFPDNSLIGHLRRAFFKANALPKEEITLAEALAAKGYRTGMIGKWHLGDHEGYQPNDFGFDEFFGVLFSNDMFPLDLYRNQEVVVKDKREGHFYSSERDENNPLAGNGIDQTTLTQSYTNEAVRFIESSHQSDTPFFLYLAHSMPHVPHYASKGFANTSAGGTYGDVVEDLDRSSGQIMAALKRLDLDDNTILMITSDNGADYNGSSGGLRGRKGDVLEGGQRVPMIVHWPAVIKQPGEVEAMAMNTDVFPTLLSAADIALPADRIIDGKDLSDLLIKGAAGTSPHHYLYYFPVIGGVPEAVRDPEHKFLFKSGDLGRNRAHLSLITDAGEGHEVSNLYPVKANLLKQVLDKKRTELQQNPRGWIDQ